MCVAFFSVAVYSCLHIRLTRRLNGDREAEVEVFQTPISIPHKQKKMTYEYQTRAAA